MIEIDRAGLLTLLHEREHDSVPFDVRPARAVDLAQLVGAAQAAIDSANLAAVTRIPSDPTWCTEGMLAKDVIVAEIAKGTMDDAEIMAWFANLADALGGTAGEVRPQRDASCESTWAWIPRLRCASSPESQSAPGPST